jgi:DNA-binding MarR family transcriptional regulator
MTKCDHVDHLVAQWEAERPDLDVSPMHVIARVSRLSRILERRIEAVYESYQLNQAQFGVLAALRRAGEPYCLSPTDLYNSLLISSGAMTSRLERLTAAGYVRRVSNPHDGRGLLVALTPKGKRLIDRLLVLHYENERELLSSLNARDRATLTGVLRRLLLQFEDDASPESSRANGQPQRGPNRRPPAALARDVGRRPTTRGT